MNFNESFIVIAIRSFISIGLATPIKLFIPEIDYMSIIGIAIFIYFCLSFYFRLGKAMPIRELIILIALIQWVIAPVLSYHFFQKSEFYYMSIDEGRYMGFVVPATFCLILGLVIPLGSGTNNQVEEFEKENPEYFLKRGRVLLILGLISFLLIPLVPYGFTYFFVLLSHTSIIGSFYILKSKSRYKYLLIFIAFVPVLIGAANSAVFHEAFIWGGFLLVMLTYFNKSLTLSKPLMLAFLCFSIFLINSVKQELRESVWASDYEELSPGQISNKFISKEGQGTLATKNAGKLFGLVGNKLSKEDNGSVIKDDNKQIFVDRLNQGWIIARIMYAVPQYIPYGDGETIMEGIYAALLPRFLAPNKAISGGHKNFERFTGMKLTGTSMNLGIIGEAYANFGESEGMLFILVYGFFFNIVFIFIIKR